MHSLYGHVVRIVPKKIPTHGYDVFGAAQVLHNGCCCIYRKQTSPHQIGAGRLLSLSQFERLVPFVNHVLFLPDLKLKTSDNSTRSATRNRQ